MEQSTSTISLITLLTKIVLVYRALFTISDQKRLAIISNNIEEVNKLSIQETKILKPVPDMEKEVKQLMISIQRELGFRPKLKMGFAELITLIVDPQLKQQLLEANNELISIADKLKHINETNYQLLQQSLEYVNFSLDVLVGPEEEEYIYKKPLQQQEPIKRTNIYDRKG